MARAVGIDFKFTGDSTKAVAAFRQVAAAAKASGGDIGAAGRQIESALNKAEAAAAKQQQSLRAALGGGTQSKGAQFLQGLTDSLGLGEFTDQFGGVEGILENVSTKTALAATGVGLVTAATVKLGVTSAKTYLAIVGQVDAVADVTGATAKEASELVGVFNGLGVETNAGASAMAKLAKAVGTNEAGLLKYGIVVDRNADGTANLSGTLLNVASAYQATADPAEKAALASAVFGKSWAEMVDVLDKSRPKLDELMNLAPDIDERDIANMEAFKLATAELKKSGDDIKVTFGRPLVQVFSNEIGKATGQIQALGHIVRGDFAGAWRAATGQTEDARAAFGLAADDLGSRLVASALQASYAVKQVGDSFVSASDRAARASRIFASVLDTQTTIVNAQVRYQDALAGLKSFQTQAASGAKKYADAQDAVASASGTAARAAADGARRIADAERESAETIARAQERVADARDRAARSAQSAADRVADAERALRDAGTVGAGDNPLEQQRRIEEAQIDLARARRDQAQDAEDSNKDIAKSEAEVVQAQEDGARRVSDARREAAEAQADALNRVTEAQGRATEAVDVGAVSVGTMTGKVDDLVTATYNAAFQTAQMGGSQADVKKKVDESKKALEEFGPQIGLTAGQIEYYRKQLDLIPLLVPTKIRVDFSVGSAVDVARRGLAAAIASTIQPPEFAGGGTFRAQGGGAGLAILHDGEKVLTPEQQQQGGVNITVNGYVGSEQQLVELISKAYRQGFR